MGMNLDRILNSDKQTNVCRKANKKELIEKLKAQSDEETKARLDRFLEEAASIVSFALDRLDEVSKEYEEIAALGDFGVVIAATLQGKPLAYAVTGSRRAINDAMQFAMLKTMANAVSEKDDNDDEQDVNEEGEED